MGSVASSDRRRIGALFEQYGWVMLDRAAIVDALVARHAPMEEVRLATLGGSDAAVLFGGCEGDRADNGGGFGAGGAAAGGMG